ncbi:MAG TPA: FUSC family protein [Pseudonocardiaceae bacterium]
MTSTTASIDGSSADLSNGSPANRARPAWLPVWSKPAALRAVRATVVVPGLFALSYKVIGDPQIATFAAFGGFATLVMASFGGRVRDKLIAHLGLAVAGSVLLVIGTAVNSSVPLAAAAALIVVFCVLFAGVGGPNAASAGTAALMAYVLPAASPGTLAMIPSRLEGWWMASIVGTVAVLLLSPKPPAAVLRNAAANCARTLAAELGVAIRGEDVSESRRTAMAAKRNLLTVFTATPYRPTGLAAADQALANLVSLLDWCTVTICDELAEFHDLSKVDEVERALLLETRTALEDIAALLTDEPAQPDLDRLEARLAASMKRLHQMHSDTEGYREAVHLAFHARTTALAVHTAMADAMIATHRADPAIVSGGRRRWYGSVMPTGDDAAMRERRVLPGLTSAASVVSRHASLRSVWFLNSVRGAVAVAAAITVADLTGVQHAFWVVLGTLSVLRSSAAATGATAMRALLGTVIGFVVGAGLLLVIGTSPQALWIALPIAVLIAAYSPGALPFAAGQAAFTVVISLLFNLIAPIGWTIGVLRIEDVAIGCAVSLVVGVLFWPRGTSSLVADDLADAFRVGGSYVATAARYALGLETDPPSSAASITAGLRLDDALRGFLAEQGAKRIPQDHLWRLVGGTLRARLTGHSLAGLPSRRAAEPDQLRVLIGEQAGQVAAWFDHLASRLDRTDHGDTPILQPPDFGNPLADADSSVPGLPRTLWVNEHLNHIRVRLAELIQPATEVATQRHRPWWR